MLDKFIDMFFVKSSKTKENEQTTIKPLKVIRRGSKEIAPRTEELGVKHTSNVLNKVQLVDTILYVAENTPKLSCQLVAKNDCQEIFKTREQFYKNMFKAYTRR